MTGLILDAPDEPLTDLSFIGLDPSVSAYAAESRPSQVPTPAQDAAPQSFAAAMAQAHAASADQTSPDGAGTRATAGTGGATGPWDGDAYNSGTYTEDGELLTGSSDPSKFTGPLTGSTTTGGTFELVQGLAEGHARRPRLVGADVDAAGAALQHEGEQAAHVLDVAAVAAGHKVKR